MLVQNRMEQREYTLLEESLAVQFMVPQSVYVGLMALLIGVLMRNMYRGDKSCE